MSLTRSNLEAISVAGVSSKCHDLKQLCWYTKQRKRDWNWPTKQPRCYSVASNNICCTGCFAWHRLYLQTTFSKQRMNRNLLDQSDYISTHEKHYNILYSEANKVKVTWMKRVERNRRSQLTVVPVWPGWNDSALCWCPVTHVAELTI